MGSKDKPIGASDQLVEQVLGYLNFSSGSADAQYLSALNQLFRDAGNCDSDEPTWRRVCADLQQQIDPLEASSPTFSDANQARRALELLIDFCPAYKKYHEDLLAHQPEDVIFNSFFVGRATEVLLSCDLMSSDPKTVLSQAIRRISDYIGYRPVATLESQKIEPYDHERIRPVPIYIEGAGVALGAYDEVVTECVEILKTTDPRLLRQAYFDPSKLEELAFDPRAYDFDHPANKRPNYHFGQWDPHHIDGDGFLSTLCRSAGNCRLFAKTSSRDRGAITQ